MEELRKKRSQIKKSITRIYNAVNNQNASYHEIKVRIDKLEEIYKCYEICQDEIDSLCENDNEQIKEDQYRSQIEDIYFAIRTIWSTQSNETLDRTVIEGAASSSPNNNDMTIQAIVQQQSTTTSLLETMSATLSAVTDMRSNATTQNVQLSNTNQSELRLPPIEIPDFDGNLSNWIRFRDLFVSMVDSRTNISNVQKLEYLQMKLKGEASTVIKHLTPTNDNYNVAWELLKENYDNSEMIVEKYLELLFDQKHVKNATASDFKKFYHNTVEAYNALKTLKGSLDSWDYVLMFHMKKKLDTETITLWRRQRKEGEIQTFPQLLKFLRNRVVEVEEEQKANASIKYQRQSKIANVATANQSCPICNDDHFLYNCSQFKALDVDKRKEVIFKNKLCFNCLKGKHISRECKSGPCKVCGLKHNTLLHMGDNVLVAEIGQQSDSDENPTTININVNQQVNHETTLYQRQ
ncbi:uncharacterized protein LOC119605504 [Lucilia sericata]|uniref:uncharacterized protein LOC119605504 n=1 Tax=Lucilia sericata TaxID=13632 RepID=UPI0018A83C3E|nr:uncharacterized protein LOC119605504 [Lucilia sericata]